MMHFVTAVALMGFGSGKCKGDVSLACMHSSAAIRSGGLVGGTDEQKRCDGHIMHFHYSILESSFIIEM